MLIGPQSASALTVNEVARDLRCITCGTTLDVSHAPSAERLKATIREKIDAGWTKSQIVNFMEDEFGRDILATPPRKGFDWLAWVVPPAIVLGGLVVVAGAARRARVVEAPASDDVGSLSEDEEERLRQALDGT
jgi:cytochrome c-type biogenesis protein CcmH